MIASPIVLGLLGVIAIHGAWFLGGRVASKPLRFLARAALIVVAYVLVGLLAADTDTAFAAGTWTLYLGIPYFIVFRFIAKRKQ